MKNYKVNLIISKVKTASILDSPKVIYIFLGLYFLVNLFFLISFPYVHSDEPWLSGLSRHMLESGSIKVTEPFFNAYLRYPHAIRLLFHLIQAGFIKIMGYDIFTFRFISLLFSVTTLFFFYQLCQHFLGSKKLSYLTVFLLSIDIQYIYASHFARQEIIILFFLVFSVYLLVQRIDTHRFSDDFLLGSLTGLSIGIHPNSFIIAVTIFCCYSYYLIKKKINMKNIILLVLTVSFFALIFIGLSLYMDPAYLSHYLQHGRNFGVGDSLFNKLNDFLTFYKNIFNQISVEYYMPNVRYQLILFILVLTGSIMTVLKNRKRTSTKTLKIVLTVITGINLGLLLIGRFNVTSIVFIFPFCYLLTVLIFQKICFKQYKKELVGLFILLAILNTFTQIRPYDSSYETYLSQITNAIDGSPVVLGNLNSEYAFEDGQFLAYRNLQYLDEQNLSFADFITDNQIELIIYYDELAFISENNHAYDVMYGDLTPVLSEITVFLDENCEEIDHFSNPTYGTNLAYFIDAYPWEIRIFRVKEAL